MPLADTEIHHKYHTYNRLTNKTILSVNYSTEITNNYTQKNYNVQKEKKPYSFNNIYLIKT